MTYKDNRDEYEVWDDPFEWSNPDYDENSRVTCRFCGTVRNDWEDCHCEEAQERQDLGYF